MSVSMGNTLPPDESGEIEGDAGRRSGKSESAFRTISEVSADLGVPQHVLRFWETKFSQIRPMKRGGGRRYYRPEDVLLLAAIRDLLYNDGYTIRGAQKLLRENGLRAVLAQMDGGRERLELVGPTIIGLDEDDGPFVDGDEPPGDDFGAEEDLDHRIPVPAPAFASSPGPVTLVPPLSSPSSRTVALDAAEGESGAVEREPVPVADSVADSVVGPALCDTLGQEADRAEPPDAPPAPEEALAGEGLYDDALLDEAVSDEARGEPVGGGDPGLGEDQRHELEAVLRELEDLRRILFQAGI